MRFFAPWYMQLKEKVLRLKILAWESAKPREDNKERELYLVD
jgi:hypothetical protein